MYDDVIFLFVKIKVTFSVVVFLSTATLNDLSEPFAYQECNELIILYK